MNEFVTWEYLGTFAGCAAAVALIIQFIKEPLDRLLPQVSTRIWVLLLSLLILIAVDTYKGQLGWNSLLLSLINAFIVAVAAMGSFDLGNRIIFSKEKEE